MGTLHLKFYSCLRLRFPDVETNPGPRRLLRLAAEYPVAMCGVCPGTLVTWPWLRLGMIYCCALRPWSQICIMCQSCWFLGSVALSCCAGASCLVPVGWRHQLVVGPTHSRGGILDLLMTDVPDLIQVAVVAPIGN